MIYVASNCQMFEAWGTETVFPGIRSWYNLGIILEFSESGEKHENTVKVAGDPTDFRTKILTNVSVEPCRYASRAAMVIPLK
jgi:hypothetical protein